MSAEGFAGVGRPGADAVGVLSEAVVREVKRETVAVGLACEQVRLVAVAEGVAERVGGFDEITLAVVGVAGVHEPALGVARIRQARRDQSSHRVVLEQGGRQLSARSGPGALLQRQRDAQRFLDLAHLSHDQCVDLAA